MNTLNEVLVYNLYGGRSAVSRLLKYRSTEDGLIR